MPTPDLSRRKFLGACCASVGATGLLSTLAQLRLMGAVASPDNGPVSPPRAGAPQPDYKALVCLFLAGGNDANNLVIPTDAATYAAYAAGRGALALPQNAVLPITPRTNDGRTWGIHPAMTELRNLFNSGQFAVLANVGTLAYPMTKAQYTSGSVPRPSQLFSHNDQQVEWQSSIADKPFVTGWGGRLADLTNAFNANNRISMSITLNGQNSFQVGTSIDQYSVGTGGAIAGAIGGAVVGNAVAGHNDKALGTVVGAGAGALVGREIDRGDIKCR